MSQILATATAVSREASYLQTVPHESRWFNWLTPPPLGHSLLLLSYWVLIIAILTTKSVISDAYYYERIGFRAAWVSVTQVPLVYFLASKNNIIGLLIGSSYERLNWLHRWVSRTLWVTVTIHGSSFLTEWIRADFVKLELAMMPMVKYGIATWFLLTWMLISSLFPIRRLAYELFILQHLASAGVLLWLLYVHVPKYAAYNVYLSIGITTLDWLTRICWSLWRNVSRRRAGASRTPGRKLGYRVEVRALPGDITQLTLQSVPFRWRPGQHIRLSIPRLGLLESHPYTISNAHSQSPSNPTTEAHLVVRAHSGFSRRVYKHALKQQGSFSMRALVSGPYGDPPTWNTFETLVLAAASTGASFTLPIVESVLENPCCVRRIDFLLLLRHNEHKTPYLERLRKACARSQLANVSLRVHLAFTGSHLQLQDFDKPGSPHEERLHRRTSKDFLDAARVSQRSSSHLPSSDNGSILETVTTFFDSEKGLRPLSAVQGPYLLAPDTTNVEASIKYTYGRPNLAEFIRGPVEATGGETSVVVCGGQRLVATMRNCVAGLSDERAVHKGTGAQGIHLHAEQYSL